MISSVNEEKANKETQAGQAGEETCALRRGPKEGLGSGEEEALRVERLRRLALYNQAIERFDDAVNKLHELFRRFD